ncbi:diguanylate cyclase [Sphingomonas sp.]|jgi:diguanylate cyclase (GGDEF)-like protein|uniref:GGDEF domain-containing protein n=1 Tax=Sphingomonas sp. TaxID=28214 RepID=UPI002E2FE605|nr:diguanylate cyclase [Sphingomonas sp.]HEX4694055.1 diguanylate cyclase [Sphingomonas sp.]
MAWLSPPSVETDSFLKVRIDAVYSIAFAMIGMDALGSAMIAGLFWQLGSHAWLAVWVVLSVLVVTGRAIFTHAYRSRGWPTVSPRVWAIALVGFAAMSGLLWGAALLRLVATGNDNQIMFVVCIALSGLTLSIANIAYWPVYVAFELPVMLAAAGGFALSGKPGHWMLAGAASIMAVALLGTSRRLSRYVLEAHHLAAANQALIDSLGERGRELEMACDALERVSNTDPLTGLANRRARDLRLADEWARSLRNGGSLAVIAIDVDRFKRFNDTHGHGEGDRALKAVADMLQAGVRGPIDLAARHGGEEFMLILPGVGLAGAASIAERVRVLVAQCHCDPACPLPEKVTISLGVAAIEPAPGRSVHELTIAADAALYQAKLAGRNRYEIGMTSPAADAA